MLNGFFRLFTSGRNDNEEELDEDYENESGFVWTEHMRIVLAIAVAIAAALFMWWIVA